MYRMSIHFTNILFLTRVIRLYTSLTSEFLINRLDSASKIVHIFSDQGIKVIYPICNKHIAGTISARIAQDTPIDIIATRSLLYVALLKLTQRCEQYDGVQ